MSKYDKPEDIDNHWVLSERDHDDFVRETDFDNINTEPNDEDKLMTRIEGILAAKKGEIEDTTYREFLAVEQTQKIIYELHKLLNKGR